MIPPLGIIALAAAPVAIIGAVAIAQRRRRDALQQYAEQRGYRFERNRPGAEIELAEAFPIFRKGRGHDWGCTITGQIGGTPFTAFDYVYITRRGKSSHRNSLAMMLWETSGVDLPRFSLGPEGF